MPYYVLQTALLLLGSFLVGAWLACVLRKMLNGRSEPVVTAGAGAAVSAEDGQPGPSGERLFGARDKLEQTAVNRVALSDGPVLADTGTDVAEGSEPASPEAVAPVAEFVEPSASPPAVAVAAAETLDLNDVLPSPDVTEHDANLHMGGAAAGPYSATDAEAVSVDDVQSGEGVAAAVVAGLATSAAAAASTAENPDLRTDVGEPPTEDIAGVADVPDDLTWVRGIDEETQARLNEAGVYRYEHLSVLTAHDVAALNAAFASPARISREGWIEQAAILARGEETHFSKRKNRRARSVTPTAETLIVSEGSANAEFPAAAAGGGLSGAAMVPEAPKTDVITEENSDPTSGTASVPDSSDTMNQNLMTQERVGDAAVTRGLVSTGVGTGAVVADQSPVMSADTPPASRGQIDDLKRIRGVGVVIEHKLNAMGVTTYQQIASWGPDDIAQVNRILDFSGRIERENWIEQARVLSGGP